MTAQTLTLTDFLLARIAEDEVAEAELGSRFHPARVLAECEAKRQIVESSRWQIDTKRVPTDRPGVYDRIPIYAVNEDSEEVLRLLALPYADHPDYNPDWRP